MQLRKLRLKGVEYPLPQALELCDLRDEKGELRSRAPVGQRPEVPRAWVIFHTPHYLRQGLQEPVVFAQMAMRSSSPSPPQVAL